MEIKNIWFEFDEWDSGYDEYDECFDVHFDLNDGTRWCASFFTYENILSLSKKNQVTGEALGGRYFYSPQAILISKVDKELIISVLKDIMHTYPNLSEVFTKVE